MCNSRFFTIFTFSSRLSISLFIFWSLLAILTFGLSRTLQPPFPVVISGETSTYRLYAFPVGCESVISLCRRSERRLLDLMHSFPVAEPSPDGQLIAVHITEEWMVYDADCLLNKTGCQPILVEEGFNDVRVTWSPDSARLAYTLPGQTGTELRIRPESCWQPRSTSDCQTTIINLGSQYLLSHPNWSTNGKRMIFMDYASGGGFWMQTDCFEMDAGCGNALQSMPNIPWRVAWPSISSDGEAAVFMSDVSGTGGGNYQLFHYDIPHQSARQITNRRYLSQYPDWSADERYVVFSGFEPRAPGDLSLYILDFQRGIIAPLAWHRGRDLAFAVWQPS